RLYDQARKIDDNNDYIVQRLALATYKSKYPNHLEALNLALELVKQLNLQTTTDTETLGIAGAIYKRIWEETSNKEKLNKAIYYYEKGFYLRNDYYNGINLAYLLNIRSSHQTSLNEAIADYVFANRVRKKIIII